MDITCIAGVKLEYWLKCCNWYILGMGRSQRRPIWECDIGESPSRAKNENSLGMVSLSLKKHINKLSGSCFWLLTYGIQLHAWRDVKMSMTSVMRSILKQAAMVCLPQKRLVGKSARSVNIHDTKFIWTAMQFVIVDEVFYITTKEVMAIMVFNLIKGI